MPASLCCFSNAERNLLYYQYHINGSTYFAPSENFQNQPEQTLVKDNLTINAELTGLNEITTHTFFTCQNIT